MFRTSDGHVVRALTIAGSDSGGGAGIQADLKTFAAFDVYGMSVITALTAQNTVGVQGVYPVDPGFVAQQMESIFSDLGADAVKTGMLATGEVIRAVARGLREHGVRWVVLDPVMVAKGGEPLLQPDAMSALQRELLPLAAVVTPNIPEASALWGRPIENWQDCLAAARDIARLGPRVVVIKGGHAQAHWPDLPVAGLQAEAVSVDVVYDGRDWTYFVTPRVDSRKTHGTGCTFSAAIAAALARQTGEQRSVMDAVAAAKAFIYSAIAAAADWDVGRGHGPTDHSVRPVPVHGLRPGAVYQWQDGAWVEIGQERVDSDGREP